MTPALLSPRTPVVAPSWAAVERVLWLAALDRCLRATPGDTARVLIALRSMRSAIRRDGPRAYAECVVDEEMLARIVSQATADATRGVLRALAGDDR